MWASVMRGSEQLCEKFGIIYLGEVQFPCVVLGSLTSARDNNN